MRLEPFSFKKVSILSNRISGSDVFLLLNYFYPLLLLSLLSTGGLDLGTSASPKSKSTSELLSPLDDEVFAFVEKSLTELGLNEANDGYCRLKPRSMSYALEAPLND